MKIIFTKGKWLNGRYENLLPGQWSVWRANLCNWFGHAEFKDPRICDFDKPQKLEMCEFCEYTRKYNLVSKDSDK